MSSVIIKASAGPITVQLPSAGSLNGGGAYHYKIYRGTPKGKLELDDRVILDPDNGSGPGIINGDDTVIATGKRVVYIKHDTGKISCVPEDACRLISALPQMPPPPPSCDCGAKAVGSDRHSNWCTLSDLTSLN